MRLKTLLLGTALALSFTVSAPTPAKADPITAAIVSFIGFTGTAAAVATFVINSALYAGASWALGKASRALGKNKQSVQERQASVLQLTLGEVPREMVFGHTTTGGSLIDAFNHGGQYGTDYVTRVIALADHAVDALLGYYVDDQYVAFSANGTQAGFGGTLSIEFRNASGSAVSLPSVASAGGWGASDKLIGVTHVWVTYKFDDKVWTQGHPQFRWTLRGLRVYDPRKDAALGYTGEAPHVWSDRTTHEFTQNAALIRYAYTRGIYVEGRQGEADQLLVGRGLSAEEAPPERVIAAANLCDEVPAEGELRYTAAGVIRASDDFVQVEEWFAAAMAGVIVQHEGGVEIEPGHAKAAVVTITDADLVIGEPVTYSPFLPDTDGGRINTVVPRYIEPAQNWADHSGPVRRDLADIAEDGGPREETLPLPIVTSGAQADRCAEIRRRLNRLERRATITLPPRFSFLEEGDWIAWQSDRRHEGATVRYRIESWARDKGWRMRLSLREIASSVYGVPDPVEDLAETPPPPVVPDPLTLPGAGAEAVLLEGDGGTIPAVRFTWTAPVDPAISAIRAEIRVLGETDVSASRTENTATGSLIVSNGVTPAATLEGRLVPIGHPSREVAASAWFTIETGGLVALSPEESEALNRVNIIDSDNWLSRGEKGEIIRQATTINVEYTGIAAEATALGLTTPLTAYANAIQALNTYLDGLTPDWDDVATDTPIVGTAFRSAFQTVYQARQVVLNAITADVAADVATALSQISAIASDSVLARGEKGEVIRQAGTINAEYAGLAARATALGITTELTDYTGAITTLNSYLTGLSPAWNDTAVDTPIVGATFRARFNDCYVLKQALLDAMYGTLGTGLSAATTRLDRIASDDWLTRGEKPEVIRQHATLNGEYAGLASLATALGITTEVTTYFNAVNAVNAYLAGLSPTWNDLTQDTPMTGATLRARFNDAYVAKQAVMDAIGGDLSADVAASLARLDAIANDNLLTRGEKSTVIREHGQITGEYTGIADQLFSLGLTSALNAYNTAYSDLLAYLGGLSPAWNDLTADTVIVGSTFRSRFNAYYLAREAGRTAIAARINTDAASALARLDVIASDSWLSAGEKPEVIRQQTVINEEYLSLAPRAVALGITTPLTNYTNAIQALNTYLGGLSPAWDNLSADTPIVGTTFRANFALCYTTKQIVMDAITADLGSDVALSLSRLDAIASDGILTRGEKPPIIREVAVINGEYTGFATRLNAASLTTALTNYNNAINALNTYLGGLSPAWNDTSVDTTINATTFSNVFRDYYLAKQAGQDAINAQTGGSVSGGFKALSGGFGSLGSSYSFVAQGDFAAFVSGSLAQASALGSGGTFSSPSATGLIGVKVTYQLVSGGTETTIFEQALDVSSDGLDQGGGVYGAVWSGSAVGQAVVALSGAVRFRLYAKLISGTNPSGATGEAAITATPPAA